MKQYNKQQVMKDAHRIYKNDFQRQAAVKHSDHVRPLRWKSLDRKSVV